MLMADFVAPENSIAILIVVKHFFQDVHEMVVKICMNPFADVGAPITSTLFDSRVKSFARKWLI